MKQEVRKMILTSIVAENKTLFEGLVPDHILDCMDREYRFGLGLLEEVEEDVRTAGALIFDVSEGSTDMGNIVAAWIQWFYVDESYRQKGVADRLLTEMYAVLESSGVKLIYADVPMYEGCNLLCAYLEAWDFAFHLVDKYELLITLGEIRDTAKLPKKLIKGVCPLAQVSAVQFKEYLSAMWKSQETMDSRLTWDKEDYEEQISCCYVKNGKIGGALLIKKVNDKYFEILHMRALESRSGVLMGMMAHSVEHSRERYKDDAYVNIICSSKQAGKVIDYLFPEHEPLLVRRGIKLLTKGKEK